ncbi:hypothetical protein [Hyphococcus sp.]|uniref:hypothetical protein n=1 Tax=Hyphococcus sp. TaxID=2038636 RepID=UPI0035C6D2B4
MSSTPIGHEFNKGFPYVANIIRQLHKRWDHGFETEHLNIVEEYIRGRLAIVIQLHGDSWPKSDEMNISVFADIGAAIGHRSGDSAIGADESNLVDACDSGNRGDHSVFVGVIEQMETVQALSLPVHIDFKSSHEAFGVGSGCYYSVTRGFEISSRLATDKLQVAILRSPIQADEFPHHMIKSGSKVVNTITSNKSNLIGQSVCKPDFKESPSGFWVGLSDKGVRVAVHKGAEGVPQIADVLYGPVNF